MMLALSFATKAHRLIACDFALTFMRSSRSLNAVWDWC